MNQEKVYCSGCKHCKNNIQPWQSSDADFLCKKTKVYKLTALSKSYYFESCYIVNKNNDCKLYEPSLFTKIMNFFRGTK